MRPGKKTPPEARLRKKCREHRLRVTPQRLGVFKALQGSKQHPNADVVFRKIRKVFPKISFDTVNRNLLSLARIGVLKVVEGYGYPKRFDPNVAPHHHFHCLQCHRIIDFDEPSFEKVKIPEFISRRYTVLDKRIILEGICEDCRRSSYRSKTSKEGGDAY